MLARAVSKKAAQFLLAGMALSFATPFFGSAQAKDFGVRGHLFKIEEPSLVERMAAELAKVDWKEVNEGIAERAKDRFSDLPNVAGLFAANEDKLNLYDLSFRVSKDIWAPQPDGNEVLIAKKGTLVNPFDRVIPKTRMFFFSGKDDKQVALARKLLEKHPYRLMPVLVDGDLRGLTKKWGVTVYYAYEHVARKMHVKKYPSLVGVKDRMLAVQEFDADTISLDKVEKVWNELD